MRALCRNKSEACVVNERVRGYKYELQLNNKEKTLLQQCAGLKRFTWNWGLAQRLERYKTRQDKDRYTDAVKQHREINQLKQNEFAWMYNFSKCIPQEALRDLDTAYANFYRENAKRREKKLNGQYLGKRYFNFPKFKKRNRSKDSFRFTGSLRVFSSLKQIQVPRLGRLRVYERPDIPSLSPDHPSRKKKRELQEKAKENKEDWTGKILSVTISREADHWFISLQVQYWAPDPLLNEEISIAGFDAGEKDFGAYSDGAVEFVHPNPRWGKQASRKTRKLHKAVSRKVKGSQNHQKAIIQLRKHYYRVKNQRSDHHHKLSNYYAKNHSVVVVESLTLVYFLKNKRQARSWSDLGHGEFKRLLEYKCQWAGTEFVAVPKFFPSSKLCSNCHGYKADLTLKDRIYICDFCGLELDRDINAARNLRWYYLVLYQFYSKENLNYDIKIVAESLPETLNACGESIRPVPVTGDRHGSAKQERNTKVCNIGLSNRFEKSGQSWTVDF